MNVRALIFDFRVYLQPQPVRMFLLGFSSGLPLLLILGTLSFWLREAGVDLKTIGFFSWIGLVYGFKWVWAPAVDRLRIPVLGRLLGRRRSWLLLSQAGVIAALAGMAVSDPLHHLQGIMVFALMCAFFSATQDIALDAYRIESADSNLQAVLAAMYQTGYRLAMIWAGAGTLALAAWSAGGETGYFPHAWEFAYLGMAASMGAFLLSSGAKGKRYALPNAEIMIHQPSAGTQGQITDMALHLKRLEIIKERMTRILAENTGKPFDVVHNDCERDNFMTAQEAVEYGLIDKVFDKH